MLSRTVSVELHGRVGTPRARMGGELRRRVHPRRRGWLHCDRAQLLKTRKVPAHEEPIMKGSFKVNEPGKVLLTVNNPASKKKKLLYRFKVKSTAESA